MQSVGSDKNIPSVNGRVRYKARIPQWTPLYVYMICK